MRQAMLASAAAILTTMLAGCDDGGSPQPSPTTTAAPAPLPTACAGNRYKEVALDAVPMNEPTPEAALARVAQWDGRSVDTYERVPVDPQRYKRKVADRYASFATRRADGSVATLTVFERGPNGWTLSAVQTCLD